jgi:hypothetical protein
MTSSQPVPAVWRPLAGILYVGASVLFVDQVAILAASVYPIAGNSVQWRFGAVGLAAGRATPFLLCDLLLLSAAFLAGHRWVLRGLGVVHLILGVLLPLLVVGFVLDSLQIRQLLPLDARTQAMASAIRAAVALGVVSAFCVVVAVRILRVTRTASTGRAADRRLVVDAGADVAP